MESSNPLRRLATSATTTWLIGIISLLVLAFEVIGPSKPAPPSAHLTLNVTAMTSYQPLTPNAVRRREASLSVNATGIRG
jgi:hypothetical protein